MKTCTACKQAKPLIDFHQHSQSKDKKQTQCKVCRSEKMKKYNKTPEAKAVWRRASHNKRVRYKQKVKANMKISNAIHRGKLNKGECKLGIWNCKGRVEAHHPDYQCPEKVMWLCAKHHQMLHNITKLVHC